MSEENDEKKETKEEVNYDMPVPDTRMSWSIMGLWNTMNESIAGRPAKVRDYISPSDLGKNYWERYQKMMGVPVTNPFETRVLRIFAAGDEFHHMMKNVCKALGIYKGSQDDDGTWSVIQPTAKTLKTLGRYDARLGGKVNIAQVEEQCRLKGFSEFITAKTIALARDLSERHPEGLPEMIYEFKSINSMAFWNKKDYLQEAYPWHRLQLYSYLKANNIEQGRLLYISKDDLITMEFPIFYPDEKLEKLLQEDLERMSYYFLNKIEPPKPEEMIFDPEGKIKFSRNKTPYEIKGCYKLNWEVERSVYFKLITGLESKKEWKEKVETAVSEKNQVIKDKYIADNGIVKIAAVKKSK